MGWCPVCDENPETLRSVSCGKARNAARGVTLTRHCDGSAIPCMPMEIGHFICRTVLLFANALIRHDLKKAACAAREQQKLSTGRSTDLTFSIRFLSTQPVSLMTTVFATPPAHRRSAPAQAFIIDDASTPSAVIRMQSVG
jgi:hypothetical protein